MKLSLFKASSILLLCLPVFAANEIYITQVGTSNNFTLDILQDGDNNEVRLSVSHDSNNLDIDQIGDNNTISWVSYWGSGQGWGGDLDGSNNTIKLEQYKMFITFEECRNYNFFDIVTQSSVCPYRFLKVSKLDFGKINT